jgi:hypothetical protein
VPRASEPRITLRVGGSDRARLVGLAAEAGISVGGLLREAGIRYGARVVEDLRGGTRVSEGRFRRARRVEGELGKTPVPSPAGREAEMEAADVRPTAGAASPQRAVGPAPPRPFARLDGLVAAREGVGIGEARRLVLRGFVRVDGAVCRSFVVAEGARVEVAR